MKSKGALSQELYLSKDCVFVIDLSDPNRVFWLSFHIIGHFGKVGMRRFHLKRGTEFCPTINLEKLWNLVPRSVLDEAMTKGKKESPVIDVTQYGFHKVLGSGKLPNAPVIVKAKMFSKLAEIKIGKVGGACLLTC